ncbi:MAG: glycosyltransferase [Bacteroidota bacterium]
MTAPRGESGRPLLLFLSDIPWDSLYQRPQHLALRLARRRPVLWLEPATLGHRVRWKPEEAAPGVFVLSVPMLPHHARSRLLRRTAWAAGSIPLLRTLLEGVRRASLRRSLGRFPFAASVEGILVENFQLYHLTRLFPQAPAIFDYIDDAFGFAPFPPYVHRLWEQAAGGCGAVSVTSEELASRVAQVRRRGIHIIPNGVEYERFAHPEPAPRPGDLPPGEHPIAGYVGSVSPWFDFHLLAQASERFPLARFVVIGPVHPEAASGARKSTLGGNVFFLGRKPYRDIPGYLRHFRAGIIPFRRTRLTEAVNPVKLYEYAAAGLPAVSTLFSDGLLRFQDILRVARDGEAFLESLGEILREGCPPDEARRLRAFAEANDWEARTLEVEKLLAGGPER